MLRYKLLILLLISGLAAMAQKGIVMPKYFITGSTIVGTNEANMFSDICAWLEIGKDSTDRGLLMPRVVDTSDVDSPKYGLVVYQIADSLPYFYNGVLWQSLKGAVGPTGPTGATGATGPTGSGSGTVTSIATTAPITGGTITTTGTIGITQSTTSTNGYLSSTDWNTFNNKVSTSRTISTTSPLSGGGDLSADRTISISNAAADGSTKGAATFTASDFDASSGLISIDYTNGQAASGSNKGFLTSTDWTTFNSKVSTTRTINTTSPITGGGDLSADRTIAINNAAADGSTKGAASFTAADFDASSGNISIDYTNGQAASASNKGFLTSADWSTFNGKQDVKPSPQINLKSTGNTTIFTTNSNSGYFIITQVLVEIDTLVGAGSAASISVGQTASAYTDIIANTSLSAIALSKRYQPLTLVVPPLAIAPNTAVVGKVNTGATYTTNTGRIIIVGFYLSP